MTHRIPIPALFTHPGGLHIALVASRRAEAQMCGISATDPAVYAAAGRAAIVTPLVTAWLPARQAAAVDPNRRVARALKCP